VKILTERIYNDKNKGMATLTKRKMQKVFMFRAGSRDVDLLRAAAELQEISQSDFIRQALRKEASRVLAGADNPRTEEVRTENR